MTDHEIKTELALINQSLTDLKSDVSDIKRKTDSIPVHHTRIDAMEKDICSLWARVWWAVGLAITTLLGLAVSVWSGGR